jgi:hypothetical protein
MVLQRLYYVYFWLGRFPEMLALTESLRAHYPGSSFVLGLHAFALEEADRMAVGFLAQSPTGGGCSVTFDQIRYTSRRLENLRDGT